MYNCHNTYYDCIGKFFTPVHAKGKSFSSESVIVDTKITRSQHLGTWESFNRNECLSWQGKWFQEA